MSTRLYWHGYGGVTTDASPQGGGHWCLVISEASTVSPSKAPRRLRSALAHHATHLTYLASWDHNPSVAERRLVTPEMYRLRNVQHKEGA